MSLALARKYRPKNFASVAVQTHVSNTLKGAIARGRVAHGYLLCGPRGTGKTTLARVLAMALNCERRSETGEPCGECASCQRIWSGSASLDVVEIDAASNRGVDDARELRERAMYAPTAEERYKVYIVDEAHMLTREAWNALLKILEEPPPRVVFVFATTEPQKIAQTAAPVLSRLQRFDLKRIGPAEIRERLAAVLAAEAVAAEPEALAMIARAADGSMRDALSLTDQVLALGDGAVTPERVREALGLVAEDEYLAMLDLIAERKAGDIFTAVGRLADAGVDFGQFLSGLADMLRAQLAVVLGGATPDVSERAREALEQRRSALAAGDLLRMLNAIGELEQRFRKSGQQQLLLETLLVRFALLDRSVELEALLRSLGAGGGGDAGGGSRGTGSGAARGAAPTGASSARTGARSERASARDAAPAADPGDWRSMLARDVAPPRSGSAERAERPAREAAPARQAPPSASAALDASPAFVSPASAPMAVLDAPADAPPAPRAAPAARPLDLNALAEEWDAITGALHEQGRAALAAVLRAATPVAVTRAGEVHLQLDEPSEIYEQAIETGRTELLAALRARFGGVERIVLRAAERPSDGAPRRLTEEQARAERTATLRRRDPVLGAAIDALDLEVLD